MSAVLWYELQPNGVKRHDVERFRSLVAAETAAKRMLLQNAPAVQFVDIVKYETERDVEVSMRHLVKRIDRT